MYSEWFDLNRFEFFKQLSFESSDPAETPERVTAEARAVAASLPPVS